MIKKDLPQINVALIMAVRNYKVRKRKWVSVREGKAKK